MGAPPLRRGEGTEDELAGLTIGGFRIVSRLGVHVDGTVAYRVVEDRSDEPALLRLAPTSVPREFARRFLGDAKLQAALDHPSVARVLSMGEAAEGAYVVTEEPGGRTLASALASGMPPDQAVRMLEDLADALDAAHGAGLLHGAVRPSTIVVGEWFVVRPLLSNFMLGRSHGGTGNAVDDEQAPYASPEELRGDEVGPCADRYSLACCLFDAIAGTPPFGRSPEAAIRGHLYEPPPRVTAVLPDAEPALDAVFEWALAKDPHRRYGSAAKLASDASRARTSGVAPDPPVPVVTVPFPDPVAEPIVGPGVGPEPDSGPSSSGEPEPEPHSEPKRDPEPEHAQEAEDTAEDEQAPAADPESRAEAAGTTAASTALGVAEDDVSAAEPEAEAEPPEPGAEPAWHGSETAEREAAEVEGADAEIEEETETAPAEPDRELAGEVSGSPAPPPAPALEEPEPRSILMTSDGKPATPPRQWKIGRLAAARIPLALSAGAIAIAAAAGLVLGRAGSEGGGVERAAAGPLEVRVPDGWKRSLSVPRIGRLQLDSPIAIEPAAVGGMLTGVVPGQQAAIDPSRVAAAVGDLRAAPVLVRLGAFEALLWRGLKARNSDSTVDVYVAPTSRGAVTVACFDAEARDGCARAAVTVRLNGAQGYSPSVAARWRERLRAEIDRLRVRREAGVRRLGAAAERNIQAREAGALAKACETAIRALRSQPPPLHAAEAGRAVSGALAGLAREYRALGRAAGAGDAPAYATAREAVGREDARLRRALAGI